MKTDEFMAMLANIPKRIQNKQTTKKKEGVRNKSYVAMVVFGRVMLGCCAEEYEEKLLSQLTDATMPFVRDDIKIIPMTQEAFWLNKASGHHPDIAISQNLIFVKKQ